MASVRLGQWKAYQHPDIRGAVAAGLMVACTAVENEDPATPHHENRLALSRAIRDELAQGTGGYQTLRFTWEVANNVTIAGKVVSVSNGTVDPTKLDDADIDFVIASAWPRFAGTE